MTFGDRRSMAGFEITDRGERSTERRVLGGGAGESCSDLVTPLLTLLTLGVAGAALLGVSDKPDLVLEDMFLFLFFFLFLFLVRDDDTEEKLKIGKRTRKCEVLLNWVYGFSVAIAKLLTLCKRM